MKGIVDFATNNYVLLLLITFFLIFALIGYFVSSKNKKESPFKIASENNKNMELNLDNIQVNNNVSLQDMVKENASTKADTSINNDPPML